MVWFAKTSAETQNGAVLGGVGRRLSVRYSKKTLEGPTRVRGAHIYIRTGRKSIRTMPLDCNDGAALRGAPVKGLDPKLRNEFCPQVSPSQVRGAYGPHDGNERTRRAIASGGVHSAQQCAPGGLVDSFPPTAPRRHSARDFGMTFA